MPFLAPSPAPHPGFPAPSRRTIPERSLRGFPPTPTGGQTVPHRRGPASPESCCQPQWPRREASPDLCGQLPGARASGFPGGCVAWGAGESRAGVRAGGSPSPSAPPRSTLTDTALSVLELEAGAAPAAVPGHRELDTLVLAAAVPHGTGVDGWGHRPQWWVQPRGTTQPRDLPSWGSDHILQNTSGPSTPLSLCLRPRSRTARGTLLPQGSRARLRGSAHMQGAQTVTCFRTRTPHLPEDWV